MFQSPLFSLIRKDILLEWRQKHTLAGMLLYISCIVFVLFLMSGQPEARTWNALFWITQLFVAVNAVAKSFLQESDARFRYYFTLVKPVTFFLGKIIYSLFLLMIMTLITLLLFCIFLGSPLSQTALFLAVSLLGSISLSAIFTFLSAIAARAHQNASLMAILGFPLAMPLLLILSKLALTTISPVYQSGWLMLAVVLLLLDALIVLLGVILFPFLWQE